MASYRFPASNQHAENRPPSCDIVLVAGPYSGCTLLRAGQKNSDYLFYLLKRIQDDRLRSKVLEVVTYINGRAA